MNNAGGFIVLHRKILDWKWAENQTTFCLFIHLLLMAKYEDVTVGKMEIKRGQVVTSLASLAKKTGQTIQQTRTAIDHLISTGEITNVSSHQNRVITIVNYDKYQMINKRVNKQKAKNQQTDQQTEQQQYNNNNNINNITNNKREGFTPPTLDEIKEYIQEIGSSINPEYFVNYWEARGWILKGGQKMKSWKATIKSWEARNKNEQHGNGQQGRSGKESSGVDEGSSGKNKPDYSFLNAGILQL